MMAELREGDHIEYLSPQECAVILHEREADALLSVLEQAHNAGFDPGIGLRIADVRAAGFKLVSERFRAQDPYSRGRRLVATVSRSPSGKDTAMSARGSLWQSLRRRLRAWLNAPPTRREEEWEAESQRRLRGV